MFKTRNLYILSITAAIVAAFTSFFSNEVKAILFLFAIIMDTAVNKEALKSKPLLLLLVFYLISFFYVFVLGRGHFSEIRNILLPYPMILMCFWMAPGLMKLNGKEARFVWYVFLICLVENLVVTTIIGRVNPLVIRQNFSDADSVDYMSMTQEYSRPGLLSYSSAHILSLLCTFLVVFAFEVKKIWKKIMFLFMAVLAVYVMYLMTITTALLFGVLFMLTVVVLYLSKGKTKRFVVLFSILAILLFVTGGLTDVLLSSSQGENYEIAAKFNDLAETILTGESQGQVAGREIEYNLTWNAIAKNPFFGGANGPDDTGQHMLVFDYWAYYGIFCLFLFVGWWKEVKRMKMMLNRKMWNAYLICLMPIILMSFFKGPFFLPFHILASIVILRVGFIAMTKETEMPQLAYEK